MEQAGLASCLEPFVILYVWKQAKILEAPGAFDIGLEKTSEAGGEAEIVADECGFKVGKI